MFARIRNRHLKIAIIMAPLLAIGGWGLAEMFDRANHPERHDLRGVSSLCAIIKKPCAFTNGGLGMSLMAKPLDGENRYLLRLESVNLLENVLISVTASGQDKAPIPMQSQNGLTWTALLVLDQSGAGQGGEASGLILRMVVSWNGRHYVSERPIRF